MLIVLLTSSCVVISPYHDDTPKPFRIPSAPVINRPSLLLNMPVVQRELDLSKQQKEKLDRVNAESNLRLSKRATEQLKNLEKAQAAENPSGKPIGINTSDLTLESDRATFAILTRKQDLRLQQIMLQLEGPAALGREAIATKVNLSPGQFELIQQILQEGREAESQSVSTLRQEETRKRSELDQLGYSAGSNPKKVQQFQDAEKVYREGLTKRYESFQVSKTTIRGQMKEKISRLLSRKQRESFDRLLGEPFDFNPPVTTPTVEGPKRSAVPAKSP